MGAHMLNVLGHHAHTFGDERIHCGTATAASSLKKGGRSQLDVFEHEGHRIGIFARKTESRIGMRTA